MKYRQEEEEDKLSADTSQPKPNTSVSFMISYSSEQAQQLEIMRLRNDEHLSIQKISDRTGGAWSRDKVHRLLKRTAREAGERDNVTVPSYYDTILYVKDIGPIKFSRICTTVSSMFNRRFLSS